MIPKKSSKELLAESALEMLSKYPVDKITVSDIAKNCNVSTRTFYNHFKDKYDLIAWSCIYLLEQRYKEHPDKHDFHCFLTFSTEIVWEYCDFFTNAGKYHGQNNLWESILDPLREMHLNLIREAYHEEITDEIYDSVTFFLYGCIGFSNHFLRSNHIPTPQDAVTLFESCLPSNLKAYLRQKD